MTKEYIILISAWLLTIIMLIKFVPKNKIRHASVIFLFKQLLTWIFGLIVAEFRLIEYPVGLFKRATRASFTFEYFVYPAICVVFNLYYPEGRSKARQLMHYFNYCSAITLIEVGIERYTSLIDYIHWSWYITWITLFITFYISRLYYKWFFYLNKNKNS